MRVSCFCGRLQRDSLGANDGEEATLYRRPATAGTAALSSVPPVRPVSPADVRRTASGRIVKQRNDAPLQPLRAQGDRVRVLGGKQQVPLGNTDIRKHSLSAADHEPETNKALQNMQKEDRTARILQPCHSPAAIQQKKLLQYMPSFKTKSKADTELLSELTPPPPCKSIFEASARRLEKHKRAENDSSLASQSATVQIFSDAYLSAVIAGDAHWADAINIAALFTPNLMLKTQDKQTFHGKAAALRRLNTGVGMLAKMLGNGTAASLPKPTVKGPEKEGDMTWAMVYSFKQGIMKYSIKSQYTFMGDKIASIQFSRV